MACSAGSGVCRIGWLAGRAGCPRHVVDVVVAGDGGSMRRDVMLSRGMVTWTVADSSGLVEEAAFS